MSWYKESPEDISGTFFEEQARMFQNKGHQVGILSCGYRYKFLQKYREKKFGNTKIWNDRGINTYYSSTHSVTPKKKHPSKIDISIFLRSGYAQYKKYKVKNGKPDVLHAQSSLWGGILASYISKKENIPYFITEHFSELILNKKYADPKLKFRKLIEEAFNESAQTFAVSNFFKTELNLKYNIKNDKLHVLPNIISKELTTIDEIKKDPNKSDFVVLNIGNLIPLKNQITLFKAVKLIKEQGISIQLNVIGVGKLKEKLQEFIFRNNLDKVIHLLGSKSRQEVFCHIQQSDCIVSASTFETFGMSIIEAHAFGKPVVAFDAGGPKDTVANENGLLIKENSPEAFADAIGKIIERYQIYNQDEIASRCIERFGEDEIYQKLIQYYNLKNV